MNSISNVVPFTGKADPSNPLSDVLMGHAEPFVKHLKYNRGMAENSIKAYRSDILQFCAYLKDVAARGVTSRQIEDYIVYLQSERENTAATVNRKLDSLRNFYKYLHSRDIISENPMEKIGDIKLDERLPVFLTVEESERLLDSIPKNTPAGYRDYALILTFLKTGLRVNEVMCLKIKDIDFRARTFKVTVKGGNERLVRFSSGLKIVLDDYVNKCRKNVEPYLPVFMNQSGKGLSRQMVRRIVKKYVEAAGIEKSVSAHTLRHSFATELVSKGADMLFVKEALNHKNIATTQIYTHLSKPDYDRKYDELIA